MLARLQTGDVAARCVEGAVAERGIAEGLLRHEQVAVAVVELGADLAHAAPDLVRSAMCLRQLLLQIRAAVDHRDVCEQRSPPQRVGEKLAGEPEHELDVLLRVVVGPDRAGNVLPRPGGRQVASRREDGVGGVPGIGDAVAVGVGAPAIPGRRHELHPADRAGVARAHVAAEVRLDLVDRGEQLPRDAVGRSGLLPEGQQLAVGQVSGVAGGVEISAGNAMSPGWFGISALGSVASPASTVNVSAWAPPRDRKADGGGERCERRSRLMPPGGCPRRWARSSAALAAPSSATSAACWVRFARLRASSKSWRFVAAFAGGLLVDDPVEDELNEVLLKRLHLVHAALVDRLRDAVGLRRLADHLGDAGGRRSSPRRPRSGRRQPAAAAAG